VEIQFLAPLAGAIAVLGVVPLVASIGIILRATRLRSRLGLRSPTRRSRLPVLAALVVVPVLIGLAAAEPVVARGHVRHIRVGAEALFVIDTSRSMLARPSEHAQTRLARAKQSALALRSSLDDVRVGLASMTDRTLPHLLPSADPDVFASVLARSIAVDAPPPSGLYTNRATDFGALAVIPTHGYFSATARRRLVVVFTDGESRPFESLRLRSTFSTPPAIETIVVRFWSDEERVYTRGLPDTAYRADPRSAKAVARLTAATGGTDYGERDLGAATARAREVVEGAQATAVDRDLTQTPLAPYLVASVLVPLSFLLFRRSR
jgi:von Willebrand factor type A domain